MSLSKNSTSRLAKYASIAGAATAAGSVSAAITVYDNGGAGWDLSTLPGDLLFISDSGVTTQYSAMDFIVRRNFDSFTSSRFFNANGFLTQFNRLIATRLSSGIEIGPSNDPQDNGMILSYYGVGDNGWTNSGMNSHGYVGLKFDDGTDVNYGWAEISLTGSAPATRSILVHRFAIEMIANTPITAGVIPEPSSLALAVLALGAAGVYTLRKKEKNTFP